MNEQRRLTATLDQDLAAMAGLVQRINEQMNAGPAASPAVLPAASAAVESVEQPRMHGPRVEVAPDAGMVRTGSSRSQQQHLDDLIRRYTARTAASKQLAQRHRRRLADSRAIVGYRRSTKEMLYPVAARRAEGARIEDIDGNSYTDITMGFGVLLFGHEPAFVREAVREHLSRGIRLGPRGVETGQAADLLCELTGMDRVAFANSGTEANAAAIRLARAATGRDRIVTFQGAYHGHADQVLGRQTGKEGTVPVSRGIPGSAVAELTVLEYGSESALHAIEQDAERIAAVIVEPVQSRHPSLRPAEFVRRLRELTARHGIVLMFDEMLTGFRPALRGAQDLYGVTPDLATYGKLLGGGFPIGAVAGRADIMDGVDGGYWSYGDDSGPTADTTFFGGTYLQHPVSMTAAHAVLTHLKEHSPRLQERLNARTTELATGLNAFFENEDFPLRMGWFGSQFRFEHRADMELLYPHLMLRGVHVWEWRNFFLSTAHTDSDIEHVADAVRGSLTDLREAGFFRTATTTARRSGHDRPAPATAPRPAPGGTATDAVAAGEPAAPAPGPEPRPKAPAARPPRPARPAPVPVATASTPSRRADFSLYFFGDYPQEGSGPQEGRYELLMEAARFADEHGFEALWMPERHFNSFGGLFPNPAVLAAALARETRRIRLNAGSVVMPLHDPIRVAEEWSMADNLSGGRVGLGVASGWNADDFVFFPERFGQHKEEMYDRLEEVKRLWRGEALRRTTGDGERDIRLFPRPVQSMPPLYTAVVSNPESYERAAEHDLGIVTNLMTQDVDQLRENIARYRRARSRHGLDPDAGRVAVLLHTYLGADHESARADAFEPMARYMRASLALFSGVTNSLGLSADLKALSEDDLDVVFRRAYSRYCDQRALIGDVDSTLPVAQAVADAGADEIVALVDFGVGAEQLRAGLPRLDALRRRHRERCPAATPQDAPLSSGQERIWFLERLLPGRTAYNEVKAIRLHGPLDTGALHGAVRRLVDRHAGLRTVFRAAGDSAVQVVRDTLEPDFAVVDGVRGDGRTVRDVLTEESDRRYDLEKGPLFTTRVVRTGDDEHVLVMAFHHIVVDAASATILCRDLSALYRSELDGTGAGLPEPDWSYADYAREQREAAAGPRARQDLAHWLRVLDGDLPVLDLPTDRPRPAVMSSRGRAVFRALDAGLSDRLRRLGRDRRATVFMTLVAGWAAMLHRVTGQDDIVIGAPVSDRPRRADELVGFFVNTVALRVDLTGDPGFTTLLDRVRAVALDAYDHAETPFEDVVRALAPPRSTDRTPVFQVFTEFQSDEPFRLDLPGVRAVPMEAGPDKALTDLTVYFTDRPEGIRCHLEYNTDLFDPGTVDRFFEVFQDLLAAAADGPGTPLSLLSREPAEGDEVPESWGNGPRRPVPDSTVHDRFAQQAAAHPGRTAVLDGDTAMTYAELDERSRRLAAALTPLAAAGDLAPVVAVWLPRGADFVAAVLAVARAGCAAVPLDPSLGTVRAAQVIAESGARLVISGPDGARQLSLPAAVRVVAPDTEPAPGTVPSTAPRVTNASPCSVIYTSGSTGIPKGVVLSHRSLADLCRWHHDRFGLTGEHRTAVVCSQSFDASLLEIWPTLTGGGTLVVADDATRRDPLALARWFADRAVDFSVLPTALGEEVLRLPAADQPPLRHLLLGGEALRTRPRPEAPYETVNVYGPTETTVLCLTETVEPAVGDAPDGRTEAVPIGRPVDNVTVRVVDPSDKPVPIGEIGELLVGGPGVSDGYLHRPDLTAERFTTSAPGMAEGPGYRTGDLVRWRPDGRLEFVGRTDDQVKIRGYRVEPEEVAQVLNGLDGIRRAAVVGRRRGNGEAYLAAYVVPAEPGAGDAADDERRTERWARELEQRLPEYMVPRSWRTLDRLPLNSSGKLDRDRLPSVEAAAPAGAEPEPGADTSPTPAGSPVDVARGLCELWAAELDLVADRVDLDASLFDLGGHSLTAMRLINRIREKWGVEYPLSRLYQEPTLRALTAFLAGGDTGTRTVVRVGPTTEQQARFANLHSQHARPQVFNVGLRLDLSGPLDTTALHGAIQDLVRRHESLRTRLVREDSGGWRQEVLDHEPVDLPMDDLTSRPEAERAEEVRRIVEQASDTALDPSTGDVLAVRLLRTAAEEWMLLLVTHHCTCDGWAVTTLLKELAALYRAAVTGDGHGLPPAPQQVEFARWQAAHYEATDERRTDYWIEELADASFTLGLPLDRPRPEKLSGKGGVVRFTVPAEVRTAAERLAARRSTTPFAVAAAALSRLLTTRAEQDEVVLNISYAGRDSRAFESLVGCTATGFALRVRDARDGTLAELVDRVGRTTVLGMEHAMPPRRVAPAMLRRKGIRIPDRLDIGLAYESSLDTGLELPGLTATVTEIAPEAARSEFIMVLTPTGDVLEGAVEFSADLWDAATIEEWTREYVRLLGEEVGEAPREAGA
ncbi:MupA/Atu3671 family FMN-dependent luciferase-like monooxygenase [Streptomyces parvus]|uniref:MupA/Atu3671 family FMN-dependent luciferase-like monooxygenase n=1 Tax=Streptomyces parvus TaxID=66428 RepID=UPI0033E51E7B